MLRYKHIRAKLHEQAIHFEILINKMNPGILKERMSLIREDDKQELLADDMSVFNRILREKGLISKYATTGVDPDFERAPIKNSNLKENESPNLGTLPSATNAETMDMLK